MSYTPTQWKAGDTVTSAKLNKIEQGIAMNSEILIVHEIDNGDNPPTLDKTWQEIHDVDICYIIYRDENETGRLFVQGTAKSDNDEYIILAYPNDYPYIAASSDDYPVWQVPNAPTNEDDENAPK